MGPAAPERVLGGPGCARKALDLPGRLPGGPDCARVAVALPGGPGCAREGARRLPKYMWLRGPRGLFGAFRPRGSFRPMHGSSRIVKISPWTKLQPSTRNLAQTGPIFAFRPLNKLPL